MHTLLHCYDSESKFHDGVGVAQSVECRTRDRKVASSNSGGNDGIVIFFGVNFLC